jgi:hypothetical protein
MSLPVPPALAGEPLAPLSAPVSQPEPASAWGGPLCVLCSAIQPLYTQQLAHRDRTIPLPVEGGHGWFHAPLQGRIPACGKGPFRLA